MRKLHIYVAKYGPEAGPKLYHALQSQAAHAGVSARLRRKLQAVTHGEPWPPARKREETLPLFPEDSYRDEPVATCPELQEACG